jgi:hypothetical protein
MQGRVLRYFMWPYQEHFTHNLAYAATAVFTRLGLGRVVVRGSVVGALRPGRSNANAVCIAPEEGLQNLDAWVGLPGRTEAILRDHPGQRIMYGDAPSMEDKPESLRRDSVRQAVAEVAEPLAAAAGFRAFVGTAAPVGDYHVSPVLEVEAASLAGDFVLPARISHDRWTAHESLAHAAIDQLLNEATVELLRKDPGRHLGTRGLGTDEIVRRAGERFMQAPALALGDPLGAGGFFALVNEISSLLYERRQGRGVLALGQPDDPAIAFDLRFARAVPLRNARWSRKVLEMGTPELALIANASEVHGLGRRTASGGASSSATFDIEFLGQHSWWMRANGRPVIRCDFGRPSVPRRAITSEAFARNFRRVFLGASQAEADRAAGLFDEVERLGHGCMLVFSEDAQAEAERLAGQGTPTAPLPMTAGVLQRVSQIDGTVILAPSSDCHAVGVILDGPAHPDCDPARGSRFNSAVRYVRAKTSGRLAVVASDDGMVDVIPMLRPKLSRRSLREMVEVLERASCDNYHKTRTWLLDRQFYLDAGMCERVNAALKRIAEEPREVGEIRIVDQPLAPDPDLNPGYFLEDDGPDAPASQEVSS